MTEHPGEQVVLDALAAWNDGDLDRAAGYFTPDVEAHPALAASVEGTTEVRGSDELREFWRRDRASYVDYRFHPERLRSSGTVVLVAGQLCGRGAASGIVVRWPMAYLCTLRGRLISDLVYFRGDDAHAADAAYEQAVRG